MAERPYAFIDCTDPANLTSEERMAEIAAILALGVLRLRARVALPPKSSPAVTAAPESDGNCLADAPETSVHGLRWLTTGEQG